MSNIQYFEQTTQDATKHQQNITIKKQKKLSQTGLTGSTKDSFSGVCNLLYIFSMLTASS